MGRRPRCHMEQMKSNDLKAPVTGYCQIKDPRPLDMKYYSVTEGHLPVAKPYDNRCYLEPAFLKGGGSTSKISKFHCFLDTFYFNKL